MVLLFLDSFDHYLASQFLRKWTIGTPWGPPEFCAGRNGVGITPGPYGVSKKLAADPGISELSAGAAFYHDSLNPIIAFRSSQGVWSSLRHVEDGRLFVDTPFGRTRPSSGVIHQGHWYYLELYSKISYTRDLSYAFVNCQVRVNEEVVLAETVSGSTYGGHFGGYFTHLIVSTGWYGIVDDLYVTSGWDPLHETYFLGDVNVQPIWPNAFGLYSQWTPVPPGNNWERVKDPTPDGDTSYVFVMGATQDLNAIDLYNLTDLVTPNGGKVRGIQAAIYAAALGTEDVDKVKFKYTLGLDFNGVNHLFGYGYSYEFETFRYNPLSTLEPLDFAVADINIMQFGQQYVREI